MSKRLPAGTIRQRADGSVWNKPTPTARNWTQIKDGAGTASAGPGGVKAAAPQAPIEEEVPQPWGEVKAKYDLDGFLPPEEVHPQHVTMDTEGNIDAKPVMIWKDAYGADRRTYTVPFHWNRYGVAHNIEKSNWDSFQDAHQTIHSLAEGGDHAAMAALVVIATGRSVDDVCALHHERVETTADSVEKGGDPSDRAHPDRVHVTFTHPRGHAYTASISNPILAKHAAGRKSEPAETGRVFDTSAKKVKRLLAKAGVDADSAELRHHVATHMAVDMLSKTPAVNIDEHGIEAVHNNIHEVSAKIAAHFGHDPAPIGMSYVPPGVQLAYLEECGGAVKFPRSYAKLKGEPDPTPMKKADLIATAEATVMSTFGTLEGHDDQVNHVIANLEKKVAKGKPCSQTEPDSLFSPLIATPSTPEETPTSTQETPAQKSSTPGPSAASLPQPKQLDEEIEKGGAYLARLTAHPGDKALYIYDEDAFQALLDSPRFVSALTPGARFQCTINGVTGYVQVDERVGTTVSISHSNGLRGEDHIDNLKNFLLKFHKPVEPTAPEPAPESIADLAGALVSALKALPDDVVKGSTQLSDLGSRQPPDLEVIEQARQKYIVALRANLTGQLDDSVMREINVALYERDYARINELVKAYSDEGSEARNPTARTTASSVGSRALPIGSHSQRKDGEYEKTSAETWNRVAGNKHVPEAKDVKIEALSMSDLRDLLARLRSQLHTAKKSTRGEIKERIEEVKERIQYVHHKQVNVRKSNHQISNLVSTTTEVSDPMDAWLRKGDSLTTDLDSFIIEADQTEFGDFAVALSSAPIMIRAQAHVLRIQKGDLAIRNRWNLLRGGE